MYHTLTSIHVHVPYRQKFSPGENYCQFHHLFSIFVQQKFSPMQYFWGVYTLQIMHAASPVGQD